MYIISYDLYVEENPSSKTAQGFVIWFLAIMVLYFRFCNYTWLFILNHCCLLLESICKWIFLKWHIYEQKLFFIRLMLFLISVSSEKLKLHVWYFFEKMSFINALANVFFFSVGTDLEVNFCENEIIFTSFGMCLNLEGFGKFWFLLSAG